jgi:hypothetical protein
LDHRLTAKDFDRKVAEFKVRVAVLTGFTALGIPEPRRVCRTLPSLCRIELYEQNDEQVFP